MNNCLVWHCHVVQNLCGLYVNSILSGCVSWLYPCLSPWNFSVQAFWKLLTSFKEWEVSQREESFEILGWWLKGIYLRVNLMGQVLKGIGHLAWPQSMQITISALMGPSVLFYTMVSAIKSIAIDTLKSVLWKFITLLEGMARGQGAIFSAVTLEHSCDSALKTVWVTQMGGGGTMGNSTKIAVLSE